MKPIKLKITGLNSFIQTQIIDFEELGKDNLFCISGSTGSGKTTIVDAIILALYGETKRGNLVDAINLSCQKAVVELTIELEGEVYVIVREIRRKSGNLARLYKESGEIIADGIKPVDAFVLSKIGLEKDQFTKVVMLQQGEFDKFLSDNRNDRMKVIEKLTDIANYKKAIELINADEREAKSDLDNYRSLLETYADVSDEVLTEKLGLLDKTTEAEALLAAEKTERGKALEEIKKKEAEYLAFTEREDKIRRAKVELDEVKKELDKLNEDKENSTTYKEKIDKIILGLAENGKKREELSGYLAKASSVKDITANLERAIREYKTAETEKKAKESELIECRAKLDAIKSKYQFEEEGASETAERENVAYTEIYANYNRQKTIKLNLEKTEKKLQVEEKKLADVKAVAALTERGKNERAEKKEELKGKVAKAEETLDKLRSDDALGVVLSSAKVGEVCPVCGNVITSLSHVDAGGNVAEAAERLRTLKEKYEKAQAALTSAEKAHASAIRDYDSAAKNVDGLISEIKEIKGSIGAEITQVQVEESGERAKKAKEFETLVTKVKTLVDAVKDKENNLTARKEEGEVMRKQQTELKALLVEKCGTAYVGEIEEKIAQLRNRDKELEEEKRKAEDLLNELSGRALQLSEKLKHKQETYECYQKEHTYCEKIDKSAVDDCEKALRESEEKMIKTVSEKSALVARIEDVRKRLAQKKEREKEYAEKEKRYGNLKELKDLVKGSAFTDFVADAFVEEITVDASARMSDLSSGQYTLYYSDGTFYVKDYFSAGESRNVSTLSGGEKFLASLSLAIAISRRTAQSRDYGFFFIDEGFGTLDGNAIETVCASLEALALDTVVGVITHREELIERIPSVLKVEKADGEKGSVCSVNI